MEKAIEAGQPPLVQHSTPGQDSISEGKKSSDASLTKENEALEDPTVTYASDSFADDDKPEYRNGEPVIRTGRDVSRFAVDLRDDGDAALTFRSIFLGTLFAGMGAALCQVGSFAAFRDSRLWTVLHVPSSDPLTVGNQIYIFKPIQMGVSTVFLLLLIYTAGNTWAKVVPRRETVIGTRLERFAGFFHFINPGPFGIKEVRNLRVIQTVKLTVA